MEPTSVSSPSYWNERYRKGETGWNLGTPTPVFEVLLRAGNLPPGKTLVLGCGNGFDALLFAQCGFDVTAVDFSAEAVSQTQNLAADLGVQLSAINSDIFELASRYSAGFDYVVEYVTYCAIDPARREEFSNVVASVLKPGGIFLALFFPLDDRPDGPPFAVSMDEIKRHFGKHLNLLSEEFPEESVAPRRGKEILTRWRKEDSAK